LIFPNYINKTEGSWCLESYNQDSISSHHLQLNQYKSLDKLASFHFNEIELEHECDPDLQFSDSVPNFKSRLTPVTLSDLDHLLEPTLNPVLINLELESLILQSHISLLENECELQFFDLDPTLESKSTLEPKLDLSHIPKSVLIPYL